MLFPDDGISMDTGNVNVWVYNNDIFYDACTNGNVCPWSSGSPFKAISPPAKERAVFFLSPLGL
ncbi:MULTISPECIES: hypothetical protein [unclassified Paenibacillus]|uniref:hypothetical protein n=2 Tax=Paenibacillus TaxID=44249 RepID=UPI0003E1E1A7|nr:MULTISPECIES: hypothetical protein [unclassified Paenibacillus]ETT55142.1 Pectate lyase/Amb allergen [Paenibacillus sp. FSL R7-269]